MKLLTTILLLLSGFNAFANNTDFDIQTCKNLSPYVNEIRSDLIIAVQADGYDPKKAEKILKDYVEELLTKKSCEEAEEFSKKVQAEVKEELGYVSI